MMSNLKRILVVAVVLALAAAVVWQESRAKRLMVEVEVLRKQLEQSASAQSENERLAAQLQSAAERARVDSGELARLRGQQVRLRQTEQEVARLKSEQERLTRRPQPAAAEDAPPPAEEPPSEAEIQLAKGFFGRDLGLVLIMAAEANNGVVPTNLQGPPFDVLAAFSAGAKHHFKASQYELTFTGSLRDLKEGEQGILAREREPAQRADGQWERVYVMTDGSGRRISSPTRDGFAAKERQMAPTQFKQ